MSTEPHIDPLARLFAEANGLDWRTLSGTGERGLITQADVVDALSAQVEKPAAAAPTKAVEETGSGLIGWLKRVFG